MGKKKKIEKPEMKYTEKQLAVLAKFGMGPALDVSEYDAAILDVVAQLEDANFYDLCDCFDEKPSKMDKRVEKLEDKGLLQYSDEDGTIKLTPLSEQFLGCRLKDTKAEKKFRKFIECLNDEELDYFIGLVDKFEIDESLLAPAEGEEEEVLEGEVVEILDAVEAEGVAVEDAAEAADAAEGELVKVVEVGE